MRRDETPPLKSPRALAGSPSGRGTLARSGRQTSQLKLSASSSTPSPSKSLDADRIKVKLGDLVTPLTSEEVKLKYSIESRLGKGSYGEVFKALNLRSGIHVAVKCIPLEDEKMLEDVRKEIAILADCDHPNVVKYLESNIVDNTLWIAMEYCGGGSASDLVQILQTPLTEEQIAIICKYAIKGLSYLHSMCRIHRDIKGGNILLTESGDVKLADFGVSAQLFNAFSRRNTFVGTPYYMSPEVIQGYVYDTKADIWSIGITAIELAELVPPYAHIHPMRALFLIPRNPPPELQKKREWSANFHDFLAKCLVKDPSKRPDAKELLKHKFLSGLKSREPLVDVIQRCKALASSRNRSNAINPNSNDAESDETPPMKRRSGSVDYNTYVEKEEGNYSTINIKDDNDDTDVISIGTFVERSSNSTGTMVGTFVDHGTFVENKTKQKEKSSKPIPVKESSSPNDKKKEDKTKLKKTDSKQKKDEAKKEIINLAANEELQAIYKKDCTIQIPFLSLSCVNSKALLSSSGSKENLKTALDQLSLTPSNLSLEGVRNKTTLGNLLAVLAHHKQKRDNIPMTPSELEHNAQAIRELTSTLKTILRV